jgi:ATP-binding cassette subfamily F protein 3
MLSINNLDIQYGKKHLFKNVSVRVNDGDRIGLIGVNGAGKSTLLKVMCGEQETDGKVVSCARHASIAYLPQEIKHRPEGKTVYQEAEDAFADTLSLQQELDTVNQQLSSADPSSPEFSSLLQRQGDLQHRLEGADIFRMKSQIEKILSGLGFKSDVLHQPSSSLSGGWFMRLMLAKHLLATPSLLLLDEPTNHLDIESLTWLENFLLTYEGSLVIISHDRTFLDKTTSSTWELSQGKLTTYKGNYSFYRKEKELRLEVEKAAYDNQQAQIRQTMRFVQRFRAKSTKAKQVQSRVKQLAKMERIELSSSEQTVTFTFPPALPSGKLAIDVSGVSKRYGDKQVFKDISFSLQRGEKMAVVGVNGAGKSTLIRILAGIIEPDSGQVKPGHNIKRSYFGQHQAQELAGSLNLLDTMAGINNDMTITQTRSLLGAFLFQGEDVDKKVQVLSGGEKSRLALAKMIAKPANLLILDEPTNHLDMSSQEVLQEAMLQYDGSIIVVSHNRYFTNHFVNKVLEIKDGCATLYEGNIDDYLDKLARDRQAEIDSQATGTREAETRQPANGTRPRGKAARQEQARIRQEKNKLLGPYKKIVQQSEAEIEKLEEKKKALEKKMADPELYQDGDAFSQCSKDYSALQRRLERIYSKWEEALEKIEAIEAEFSID